jgi:hypothetical protein
MPRSTQTQEQQASKQTRCKMWCICCHHPHEPMTTLVLGITTKANPHRLPYGPQRPASCWQRACLAASPNVAEHCGQRTAGGASATQLGTPAAPTQTAFQQPTACRQQYTTRTSPRLPCSPCKKNCTAFRPLQQLGLCAAAAAAALV